MIIGDAIFGFIKGLISPIWNYFKEKQNIKAKQKKREDRIVEAKTIAQIVRIEKGDTSSSDMDILSANNRGWKDEYLLLIATVPLILSFIPSMVGYVNSGFIVLNQVPEWYKWVLLGVYIDTFGFRRILRTVLEKYLEKRFI